MEMILALAVAGIGWEVVGLFYRVRRYEKRLKQMERKLREIGAIDHSYKAARLAKEGLEA